MLLVWQEEGRIPAEIALANSYFAVVLFDIKAVLVYDAITIRNNRNCLWGIHPTVTRTFHK